LVGYHPDIWEIVKLNSNYGCLYQESIAVDKDTLKFLSHVGVVEYNGSNVVDIDLPVENIFQSCNNLTGEYNQLNLTSYADFNQGTYNDTKERFNSLTLNDYEFTWNEDYWSVGVDSNTMDKFGLLMITTTTEPTVTHIDNISLTVFAQHYTDALGYYYNGDQPGTIEQKKVTSPIIGQPLHIRMDNPYQDVANMYDTDADSETSHAKFVNGNLGQNLYAGYVCNPKGVDTPNIRKALPQYSWLLPVTNSAGEYVDKVRFTGVIDFDRPVFFGVHNYVENIDNLLINTEIYCYATARFIYAVNNESIIINKILKRRRLSTVPGFTLDGTRAFPPGKFFSEAQVTDAVLEDNLTDNVFEVFNPRPDLKCSSVWLSIKFDTKNPLTGTETMRDFGSGIYGINVTYMLNHTASVPIVYDVSLYGHSNNQVYKSDGYYTSVSTNIGGATNNLEWGMGTFRYNDDDGETTSMTNFVRTSTSAIGEWSSYQKFTSTHELIDTGTNGDYVQFKSSFSTTDTSNTPILDHVTVRAVEPIGYWTSAQYNVGQVKGDWSYFVAQSSIPSNSTVNYWIKVGTSATDLDYTSWSSISTNELITGTTNENWIQFKASATVNTGQYNPEIYSISALYAPESAPVTATAISIKDRYFIGISTISSGTSNDIVMVYDKNGAWTKFTYDAVDFTKFGNEYYFTDGTKIFKLDDTANDDATDITSEWKKRLDFKLPSRDKHIDKIYTIGAKQTSGTLTLRYNIENNTDDNDITIDMSGTGILSHKSNIPSHSGVKHFDLIYRSVSPLELHKIYPYFSVEELR